jgi:ATPase subunit of ABC transporter with duplicated ATPase domains
MMPATQPAAANREPATAAALVHADGVSKWYGQVSGLNNVTVSIPPGVTGLLGPNGAGKSTFMKLMTGQLKPSQGTIRVLGEPIWGNPEVFARIGFCPEQDAFYDRMTGLEWVTALVRLNGLNDAEAEAAAKRGPGSRRPDGRRRQEDWRLQQGHAPARQARAGPRPRSRAADPG